ncbi:TerD family protein [Streptomyces sp. KL110A]|uniref:TerD family protein n=1 Tax=Streptomyces sp. KL110A TaxID=3384221 RepID=UPI0038C22B2F
MPCTARPTRETANRALGGCRRAGSAAGPGRGRDAEDGHGGRVRARSALVGGPPVAEDLPCSTRWGYEGKGSSGMTTLNKGGNGFVPSVPLRIVVRGRGVDAMALLLTERGLVRGDADVVFHGQPAHPNGAVRLLRAEDGTDWLELGLPTLEPDVARVLVVGSTDRGALRDAPGLGVAAFAPDGTPVADYEVAEAAGETAMVLAELYRRAGGWKFRAVGQGWADGLEGLATDHGVHVADAEPQAPAPTPPAFSAPAPTPPAFGAPAPAPAPPAFRRPPRPSRRRPRPWRPRPSRRPRPYRSSTPPPPPPRPHPRPWRPARTRRGRTARCSRRTRRRGATTRSSRWRGCRRGPSSCSWRCRRRGTPVSRSSTGATRRGTTSSTAPRTTTSAGSSPPSPPTAPCGSAWRPRVTGGWRSHRSRVPGG